MRSLTRPGGRIRVSNVDVELPGPETPRCPPPARRSSRAVAEPASPSLDDLAVAATHVEQLLAAVDAGVLTARTPAAIALRRRLEGALVALRAQVPASGGSRSPSA